MQKCAVSAKLNFLMLVALSKMWLVARYSRPKQTKLENEHFLSGEVLDKTSRKKPHGVWLQRPAIWLVVLKLNATGDFISNFVMHSKTRQSIFWPFHCLTETHQTTGQTLSIATVYKDVEGSREQSETCQLQYNFKENNLEFSSSPPGKSSD